MRQDPVVSIIIPAFGSDATLESCLLHLEAQEMKAFEVIVIDSSPSDQFAGIAASRFPWVRYEHVAARMLPHEARNHGAAKAAADLLIFTDPDIYAPPDWIPRLLAGRRSSGELTVGSVSCYGEKWVDRGAHFAKFDLWLPGGPERLVQIAPTVNLLCPRQIYDEVGGFPGEHMLGDTLFSWDVLEAGHQIRFVPSVSVSHHHATTWSGLLWERFGRGREFGHLRPRHLGWGRIRIFLHLLVTIFPVRWLRLSLRVLQNARAAGLLGQALWTLPVIATAEAAWLLGECRGFIDLLTRGPRR